MTDKTATKITIAIKSNRHHVGKTTVAVLIRQLMTHLGFENITVESQDGDMGQFTDFESLDKAIAAVRQSGVQIEIQDLNELTFPPAYGSRTLTPTMRDFPFPVVANRDGEGFKIGEKGIVMETTYVAEVKHYLVITPDGLRIGPSPATHWNRTEHAEGEDSSSPE